jgi:hypothetical protein
VASAHYWAGSQRFSQRLLSLFSLKASNKMKFVATLGATAGLSSSAERGQNTALLDKPAVAPSFC